MRAKAAATEASGPDADLRPLRICFVTDEIPGISPYTGGIGVQFLETAKALAAAGDQVTIVVHRSARDLRFREEQRMVDGVTVRIRSVATYRLLGIPKVVAAPLSYAFALGRCRRFDVVFAPEWGGWATLLARLRHPSVLMATCLATSFEQVEQINSDGKPVQLIHRLQKVLERHQAEHSDLLIGVSTAIVDWTRLLWNVDHIPTSVVHNGLDIARIRAAARSRRDAGAARPFTVYFAGRISPWKGADTLMEAMRGVWSRYPEVVLTLAGRLEHSEGPLSEDGLRADAAAAGGRLRLLGQLGRDELFGDLAASDVAAFPSRFEAFGIAALEAKIAGKPVIVTSGSGFTDFCTDGEDSLVVAPGNAVELEQAIVRLYQDGELRRRLGEEAAIRSEELDIRLAAKRLRSEFVAALDRCRPAPSDHVDAVPLSA
jgi:glycosyltransferase involved in cell wall biosynthesis